MRAPWACLAMGLAIGWSNLAYVIGVLEGEVMRVLLLFYLAPLWTVPLAHVLLGERLDARGGAVMAIAIAGAAVMLWHPELGVPWPASRAEWLGRGGGLPLRARQRARARASRACATPRSRSSSGRASRRPRSSTCPLAPTTTDAAMRVAAVTWGIWLPRGLRARWR